MSTTTDYFVQAELSLAAYSQLYRGISTNDYINALIDQGRGMSTDQAARFAQTYSVAAQYSDGTGLSATVFVNNATGSTSLAIRGTDAVNDVITDVIDIGLFGTTAFQ